MQGLFKKNYIKWGTLVKEFIILFFLLAQHYLTLGGTGWGTRECTKKQLFDWKCLQILKPY